MVAPFNAKLWINCVLQLAERHDFVMSALLALSSMHESYSQKPQLQEQYQSFCFLHYNKALKKISQITDSETYTHAILISSIVFYSLESLRGCLYRALQHVQSGLKIVRHQPVPESNKPSTMTKSLIRDFLSLQNQIMELGTPSKSRAYDVFQGFEPPFPDTFKSLDDALHYIEVLYSEVQCVIEYFEEFQKSGRGSADILSVEIVPRCERIQERFNQWSMAFARLETSLSSKGGIGPQDHKAILILKIYQTMQKAILDSFFTGDCFSKFDADIARTLDLIEHFLHSESRIPEQSKQKPTFSLSLGIIPVLTVIAIRCNYAPARDRSMELLALTRRREGAWDSAMILQIAKRCIAFKEHMAQVGNEHHVHVSHFRFVSDTACRIEYYFVEPEGGSRRAWLTPKERVDPYKHEEVFELQLE